MKSSMKRLAKDQVAIRKSLPPNYLFESLEAESLPDNLTELLICLTGPEGTPYSQGLWSLRLEIPVDYPQSPPTAAFKTRIFHPNVAEETGAVCLETLKRDWDPNLTLKDILITISCLLIQPNPDSALNQKAGALIQEDYDAFARQAKLMTRIHAPIPEHLKSAACEARRRGEEASSAEKSANVPQHPTDHPSLKENQSSQNIETVRNEKEKPLKRPITDLLNNSDPSHALLEQTGRRRKSSKHEHLGEEELRVNEEITVHLAPQHDVLQQVTSIIPTKVIFRAQWSKGAPKTARIGIRRL
ncbi:hypothetical protein LTS08_001938 [Lithohypha guttulata]|uniref:uncharacterized protein n=1 Tax=Lithohypha guttulata TaxID=1690604 RepID=UPI002DE176E9|nr:hypothetical protein LTR51_004549 [Lithohypha guttulata]KAK5104054.1 hypothetical protein LTS08_001938 [Lithohypha guttulata]